MPLTITSPRELADQLGQMPAGLFAIDGYHGSGKSTLGNQVASFLGIPLVQLDAFLTRDRGGFVEFLRYSELSLALRSRPVVVEGVCILAAFGRLGIEPDVYVYVQSAEPDADTPRGTGPLAAEVLAYHREFQPADIADIRYVGTANFQEVGPMESRKLDVDIAFIQAKTKLAVTLALGGMLTLVIGMAVLLYGVTGQDRTIITAAGIEISASGLGGVIMATSAIWAFFAYKTRPTYSRIRQTSERYDTESRRVERHEHESTTQIAVGGRKT